MHVRPVLVAYVALLAAFVLAPAIGHARAPTNEEQLMVELVNRMRADPQSELAKLANINTVPSIAWGSPKSADGSTASALMFFNVNPTTLYNQWQLLSPAPPVAWNENLAVSAQTYSNVMIAANAQAHNLDEHKFPNGSAEGSPERAFFPPGKTCSMPMRRFRLTGAMDPAAFRIPPAIAT
jgi:hypothetical protein